MARSALYSLKMSENFRSVSSNGFNFGSTVKALGSCLVEKGKVVLSYHPMKGNKDSRMQEIFDCRI